MNKDNLLIIKENLLKKEDSLSEFACKSVDAIRLYPKKEDIRPDEVWSPYK